jgi:hypothetical protein
MLATPHHPKKAVNIHAFGRHFKPASINRRGSEDLIDQRL